MDLFVSILYLLSIFLYAPTVSSNGKKYECFLIGLTHEPFPWRHWVFCGFCSLFLACSLCPHSHISGTSSSGLAHILLQRWLKLSIRTTFHLAASFPGPLGTGHPIDGAQELVQDVVELRQVLRSLSVYLLTYMPSFCVRQVNKENLFGNGEHQIFIHQGSCEH